MLEPLNSNETLNSDNVDLCITELIHDVFDCQSNDVCTQLCDSICKPWVR